MVTRIIFLLNLLYNFAHNATAILLLQKIFLQLGPKTTIIFVGPFFLSVRVCVYVKHLVHGQGCLVARFPFARHQRHDGEAELIASPISFLLR